MANKTEFIKHYSSGSQQAVQRWTVDQLHQRNIILIIIFMPLSSHQHEHKQHCCKLIFELIHSAVVSQKTEQIRDQLEQEDGAENAAFCNIRLSPLSHGLLWSPTFSCYL